MSARVCLVGPAYPYRGGIAHFTSVLADEFSRHHDVLLVNFTRLYPSLFFPGTTQYDTSESPLMVESHRLIDSVNPLSYARAARVIRDFGPDLVVFQWWHPFFAPAYAGILFSLRRKMDVPVVFLCHNVLPHESSPVDRMLIHMGFRQVEKFLVQSQEDRTKLLRLKPRAQVAVQPHPIYDVFRRDQCTRESARKALDVSGDVVLFFGLVRAYKGLGYLLEAFAELVARRPATLFVVGEFYEDRAPYLERIEALGIRDHVRLVDRYVPDEEVEPYFMAADLVVLPYLSATQSGIVQIAYAFDKPVVVTRVGGLPDVVDDGVTGYVVPPRDPHALCEAMERHFSSGKTEVMADAVAAAKPRFSWERCRRALLDLAAGVEGTANG